MSVAVIDTGIFAAQREDKWLQGIQRPGNEDLGIPSTPKGLLSLGAGHGTFVAGIIQQLAPTAKIRAYRALQGDGLGTEIEVALAMMQAVRDGAQIVNLSLGIETLDDDDDPPVALEAAVQWISRQHPEVLLIAAAGNGGSTHRCWPGAFAEVTSVAALGLDGERAAWSTHGDWVDISTIGEGVLSTYVPGREDPMVDTGKPEDFTAPNPWAVWSGTSFAAPQITGEVARLLADEPQLTPTVALERLRATGANNGDGYGHAIFPGPLDRP